MKRRPPWLLLVAVVGIIGQTLVLFALGPSLVKAASVVVAALFAALMLRGSRLAWGVVLIGAAGQLVSSATLAEGSWALVAGGALVVCLIAPPSVQFVWTQRPHREAGVLQLTVKGSYERIRALAYGALARVAQWENSASGTDSRPAQRSYGVLVWRLGVGCVLLLLLVGATYSWQQGSGRDSGIVHAIASVTWTCYALVQLAFIAVVLMAVHQHFTTSRVSRRTNPQRRA